MQNNPQTVQRVYLASVGFMAMVVVPAYGCVAVVPGTMIYGLFGPEWAGAIPFLIPLALAMPFTLSWRLAGRCSGDGISLVLNLSPNFSQHSSSSRSCSSPH